MREHNRLITPHGNIGKTPLKAPNPILRRPTFSRNFPHSEFVSMRYIRSNRHKMAGQSIEKNVKWRSHSGWCPKCDFAKKCYLGYFTALDTFSTNIINFLQLLHRKKLIISCLSEKCHCEIRKVWKTLLKKVTTLFSSCPYWPGSWETFHGFFHLFCYIGKLISHKIPFLGYRGLVSIDLKAI